MKWVIICASIWLQYDSIEEANVDQTESAKTSQSEGCGAPQQATPADIAYYRSKKFPKGLSSSLQSVERMDEFIEEFEQERESEEAKKAADQKKKDDDAAAAKMKEEAKAAEQAKYDDWIKRLESEGGYERHCTYTFVYVAKNTLKMNTDCYMLKVDPTKPDPKLEDGPEEERDQRSGAEKDEDPEETSEKDTKKEEKKDDGHESGE